MAYREIGVEHADGHREIVGAVEDNERGRAIADRECRFLMSDRGIVSAWVSGPLQLLAQGTPRLDRDC